MNYLIEFNSVFEANKGIKLINSIRFANKLERDHKYGVLKFSVDEVERSLLLQNNIGFAVLDNG